MSDAKLDSVQDIEELQQKVKTYKETLSALKSGNSIEEALFMRKEFANFKEKTLDLEELVKNVDKKQNDKIKLYEKEVTNLTSQLESLNLKIEALTEKITSVTRKEIEHNDRPNKVSRPNLPSERMNEYSKTSQNGIPTYRQLKKMLTHSQYIDDIQARNPIKEAVRNDKSALKQSFAKENGSYNQQINANRKSLDNLNEPAPTRFSIKLSNPTFPLTDDKAEADIPENFDKQNLTNISGEQDIPEKSENEVSEKPVQKNEHVQEVVEPIEIEGQKIDSILTQQIVELIKSEGLIQKIENLSMNNESIQKIEEHPKSEEVTQNIETRTRNGVAQESEIPLNNEASVITNHELFESPDNEHQQETHHKDPLSFLNFFRKK